MTFTSDDEYGDLLRRAMRAEADSIVPSPDGLDIIRGRIERRGVRGLLWWRIGAAAAGAVLVAGTVVMVVPELRNSVIEQVGTVPAENGTSIGGEASGTSRPAPPIKITTAGPSQIASGGPRVVPTAGGTQRPSPKSSPTPSKNPCATPSVVEPQDDSDDPCPPSATPSGQPTTEPSQTPSVTPSPSPSGCGDSCSPSVTPSSSDSASVESAPDTPAS